MKKSSSPTITNDEWLSELLALRAMREDGDGLTVAEMIEATGLSRPILQRKLRLAKLSGKLLVARKMSERIDGIMTHVNCYRLRK